MSLSFRIKESCSPSETCHPKDSVVAESRAASLQPDESYLVIKVTGAWGQTKDIVRESIGLGNLLLKVMDAESSSLHIFLFAVPRDMNMFFPLRPLNLGFLVAH